MATVHGIAITNGWPPPDPEGSDRNLTTIDITVDGKYVRIGDLTSLFTDSSAVQTYLEDNSDILLDVQKQQDNPFPLPTSGTDRPDLIPADFDI